MFGDLIKNFISNSCFYGYVTAKPKKFKSGTSKHISSLENLIRRGYNLATIAGHLRYVILLTI